MRLPLKSLQARIALLHILAIAIAAMLMPFANYYVIHKYADQFETRTLNDHAQTIGQYLQYTPRGWQLTLPQDLSSLYAHGLDGLSYAVVDGKDQILFSSGPAAEAALVSISAQGLRQYSENGTVLYGVAFERSSGSDHVWIKVAQNIQHPDVIFDDIVAGYLGHIGWFTVTILALLLVIDIALIRRAFVPVLRASEVASVIDLTRINLRLSERDIPQEILPLIVAMNQALDRLEKGIRLQREFTADAAHELRTPLAVLRARVEIMPDQEALIQVKADIAVMTHVVDQLMEIAEIEGTGIALAGKTDISAVSADAVAMLAPFALRQDKTIALLGAERPVWVRGDATMIFRALRNLVDNAIKHTPRGTDIEVEIRPNGTVAVSDFGKGIPEKDRENIFHRFWRADRNLSAGTGLGLAIVARIAEIHGGTISVSARPEGGSIFTLSLPVVR
jgi:signal transduction histidine kinase